MRTLAEIIECIKDGYDPSYEELYWAMLAMEALANFDSMDIRRLLNKGPLFTPEYVHRTSFDRWKKALNKDPKTWVGTNNDPKTTEYQRRRKIAKKIFDKVMNKDEPHGN